MSSSKIAILEELRANIRGVEHTEVARPRSYLATSLSEFNHALPGGGLLLGSFVEVLAEHEGSGAFSLALKLAGTVLAQRPVWAVIDTDQSFHPLAAAQSGLNLDHLVVIRTEPRRAAWAFSQLLRSPFVGASFLVSESMDAMAFRRFQLAAERGSGLGFVMRPLAAAKRPCWASLRLKTQRHGAGLRITLLHVRNGTFTGPSCLDVDA